MQSDEDRPGDDPATLNSGQWRELQVCVGRLERTLGSGASSVDLLYLLPPPGAPHRCSVLHALIRTEIQHRFARGERCLLDQFLARYPELGGRDKLPVDLVYAEFRIRREFGDHPGLGEYRERFPRQFDGLRRLAERHAPASAEKASPAIPPGSTIVGPPSQIGLKAPGVPAPLQPLVGYEKLQPLGQGEFGEVWKALAPGGVEVALKSVLRALDHRSTLRELKALERIKQTHHPFLLQTHSFGTLDGKLTIVMELADRSLSDRFEECVKQGLPAIPVAELVTYFGQAAEALDYLRSQHIAHRDIKPQNLLTLQGFAKVADFGLARGQDEKMEEVSAVCGTPYYLAPEGWAQRVSEHSDQYSLAATYVHMRLGRPLFEGSFPEVFLQHLEAEPKLDPLPQNEQAVLKRALAKEPDGRFPSCVAFAEALKETIAPPPSFRDRGKRQTVGSWVKAGVAVSILAVLVLFGYKTAFRPRPPDGPKVDWEPKGWMAAAPDGRELIVKDMRDRRYYRRLVRNVDGQEVVMVVVPQLRVQDPETFYIMENKVWNDLYAQFYPKRGELFKSYTQGQGRDNLASAEPVWQLGATVGKDSLGVEGLTSDGLPKGRLPVFRVKATEAYCFAQWLDPVNGSLPTRAQWFKASGLHEDPDRPGPFEGDGNDPDGLAIGPRGHGPWPVEFGNRDHSKYDCRQMATNGREWTRDLDDGTIPLREMYGQPDVHTVGRAYDVGKPLTFQEMEIPEQCSIEVSDSHVTFRIILQQR